VTTWSDQIFSNRVRAGGMILGLGAWTGRTG
jgi:hypothetical protein